MGAGEAMAFTVLNMMMLVLIIVPVLIRMLIVLIMVQIEHDINPVYLIEFLKKKFDKKSLVNACRHILFLAILDSKWKYWLDMNTAHCSS